MSFRDKVVLVTGGSRGIGKAISVAFAQEGARVIVNYRSDRERAEATLHMLSGTGHHSIQTDITNPEAVSAMVDEVIAIAGKIDILINNAGVAFHHPIQDTTYQEWQDSWQKIMNINLTAPANVCYCVAKHMIENQSGTIINISSRGAFRGEPLMPAYGASKAGLNAMTQSLAHYLAPHQIFVGAIAPGFVETDMSRPRLQGETGMAIKQQSPLNRVAKPEEVAQAAIMMASSPLWMTGNIFDVNGASHLRM